MSGSSYKHYYESMSSVVLADDCPASTYATLTAIDNVLHLVDSSPVYRINWVDNVGIKLPLVTIAPGLQLTGITLTHYMPATIIKEWQYTNYDIRVATSVSSSTLLMYAAITNPHASGSSSDPSILGALFASATNTSPAWSMDGLISVSADNRNKNVELVSEYLTNTEIAIDHAGKPGVGNVVRVQFYLSLLAAFESEDPANAATLYGIQVREYVNDG